MRHKRAERRKPTGVTNRTVRHPTVRYCVSVATHTHTRTCTYTHCTRTNTNKHARRPLVIMQWSPEPRHHTIYNKHATNEATSRPEQCARTGPTERSPCCPPVTRMTGQITVLPLSAPPPTHEFPTAAARRRRDSVRCATLAPLDTGGGGAHY